MKFSPIDPVFSNWVNFIEKMSIINCFGNSKSLKEILRALRKFESCPIVLEIRKLSFFFKLCPYIFKSNKRSEDSH